MGGRSSGATGRAAGREAGGQKVRPQRTRRPRREAMGLILTRHEEETVRIGDQIVLKVIKIQAGLVRLDFSGPRSIKIMRGELPADDPPPGSREGDPGWGSRR